MKTKITFLSLAFSGLFAGAQTVADFESFTLTANSAYSPAVSTPFQTSNAIFQYQWDPSFGGFWSKGCAYTNIQDSINGTYTNLYGVRALKGYSNSAIYVVAQDSARIKLKAPYDVATGFYITNTTYAYKSIVQGNMFSRKFGDTTGTGSGTTIPQGSYPDFFKVTAKGFKNGSMKQDSSVFFLADFRSTNNTQDYTVSDWRWFNTSNLGSVDSIQFFMYSSDISFGFINTPLFFAIDNFSTTMPNLVGLDKNGAAQGWSAFPNPFNNSVIIRGVKGEAKASLRNVAGMEVYSRDLKEGTNELDLQELSPGIYFLEISSGSERSVRKLIKE